MALTNHILPDSPTNNFATWNPLYSSFDGTPTLSDGNLKATPNITQYHTAFSNLSVGSGKWYCEICITGIPNSANYFGIGTAQESYYLMNDQTLIGATSNGYSFELSSGSNKRTNNSNTTIATPYIPFSSLDIFQIYMDLDAGKVWFGNNNTYASGGNPNNNTGETFSGLVGNFFIAATLYTGGITSAICNFGQDPTFAGSKSPTTTYTDDNGIGAFYYQPPTGALALCTANLPEMTPDVTGDVPQDYFKTMLWTGDDTSSRSITGVGFQPDLVWAKARSASYDALIFDAIRGSGKSLTPSSGGSELTDSGNGYLSALNSDGFEISSGSFGVVSLNESDVTYVAWCWKAGGPPDLTSSPTKPFAKNGVQYETLSAANITAGTITPTAMSVNTDAGFSIVSWSGDGSNNKTLGHGLSKAPQFIVTKARNYDWGWYVWADAFAATEGLSLNTTASAASLTYGTWGTKTSTTIEAVSGTNGLSNVNGSEINYIAYCWHSVEGFSKFGIYSGSYYHLPYIYTGFKPAFVMIKCSSSDLSGYGSWIIYDNARDPYNQMNKVLYANKSVGEGYRGDGTSTYSGLNLDFLSNGFKIQVGASETNGHNGGGAGITQPTYIYMAFAEQPFNYANAR